MQLAPYGVPPVTSRSVVRSEPKQAADCYRKVIEFIRAHPDQYGPDLRTVFEDMVAELDPPAAA
jgi:hypothetical protein